jgi:hypothetical protein
MSGCQKKSCASRPLVAFRRLIGSNYSVTTTYPGRTHADSCSEALANLITPGAFKTLKYRPNFPERFGA